MPELRFIVNTASGGRQGLAVLADLQRRFGPERAQPFRPQALDGVLESCRREGAVLVACGGDGTVAAALEAGFRSGFAIPVGVMPLGTGNDLARILGWPLRPTWDKDGIVVEAFSAGLSRRLDRWTVDGALARGWYNYFSLGYDARIAHRFHALRRHHPRLFLSPLVNRSIYAVTSLTESTQHLRGAVRMHVGGPESLRLPPWASALLFANIPSYAGGHCLGSQISADDGRLDVFALPAGLSLSLALGRMRTLRAMGAPRSAAFTVTRPLAVQIDGEPILAPPGDYHIAHGGSVQVLLPRSPLRLTNR